MANDCDGFVSCAPHLQLPSQTPCGPPTTGSSSRWRRSRPPGTGWRTSEPCGGSRYSATNVLMIMSQRPDASLVAGFGTWKRMGRHVRKGARGIAIWAPMLRRATDAADDACTALRVPPRPRLRCGRHDGSPLPAPPKRARATLLGGAAPEGMWASWSARRRRRASRSCASTPSTGPDGANGMTSYAARRIELALEGRSPASLAKTLAHELAHVALHEGCSYLERREQLEVEAESVAFLVCAAFGSTPWTIRSATCRTGRGATPTSCCAPPTRSATAHASSSSRPVGRRVARRLRHWPTTGV